MQIVDVVAFAVLAVALEIVVVVLASYSDIAQEYSTYVAYSSKASMQQRQRPSVVVAVEEWLHCRLKEE